jgi:organic radical activating enzyme
MKAKITEIFDSVQGEGLYLGEKTDLRAFLRMQPEVQLLRYQAGHLYGVRAPGAVPGDQAFRDRYHSISLTGGEPLLYTDFLKDILKLTRKHGHRHYLETNGTLAKELEQLIDHIDIVAMDLKLPSSTGLEGFLGRTQGFPEYRQAQRGIFEDDHLPGDHRRRYEKGD